MGNGSFNSEHKAMLDSMLLSIPFVRAGKMFGYPAYYSGKKLFACVYEDGVGLKLPAEQVGRLLDGKTFVPFQPLGRPKMREWVQICRVRSADYQSDLDLFIASAQFVNQNPAG
jgi:hypothetical protein